MEGRESAREREDDRGEKARLRMRREKGEMGRFPARALFPTLLRARALPRGLCLFAYGYRPPSLSPRSFSPPPSHFIDSIGALFFTPLLRSVSSLPVPVPRVPLPFPPPSAVCLFPFLPRSFLSLTLTITPLVSLSLPSLSLSAPLTSTPHTVSP